METITVATWNSQGYKFGDGYVDNILGGYRPDVLCLQECGNLSNFFTDPETYMYRNDMYIGKRGNYSLVYYPWRGGCRCSMAVMVKDCHRLESATLFEAITGRDDATEPSEKTEADDGECELRKGLRPIMRVRIGAGRSSVTVCNAHLPSGCPAFARKVGYAFLTGYKPRDFIMAGDMNTVPEDWNLPARLHVTEAGRTYPWDSPSRCYDYCITDIGRPRAAETYFPGTSDHLAAVYEFDI